MDVFYGVICFRAGNNQYPCGDDRRLLSEISTDAIMSHYKREAGKTLTRRHTGAMRKIPSTTNHPFIVYSNKIYTYCKRNGRDGIDDINTDYCPNNMARAETRLAPKMTQRDRSDNEYGHSFTFSEYLLFK